MSGTCLGDILCYSAGQLSSRNPLQLLLHAVLALDRSYFKLGYDGIAQHKPYVSIMHLVTNLLIYRPDACSWYYIHYSEKLGRAADACKNSSTRLSNCNVLRDLSCFNKGSN